MSKRSPLLRGLYRRGTIWWMAVQRDGKRRWISLETSDEMEAIRKAEQVRGLKLDPDRTPMTKAIDRFLAEKRRLHLYSRATEQTHGLALREFAARAGARPMEAIGERMVREHYHALQERVAETTAQIYMRALRAFFNWCVGEGLCPVSPCRGVKLAKIRQAAREAYCTREQREQLIAEAPTDDLRFILLCGFDAGMRRNEIVEARAGWFDLAGQAIHLQNTATLRLKDNEARSVPMKARFREFLRGYLAGRKPDDFALRPEVKHGRSIYRYDFTRPWNDFLDRRERMAEHVAAWHAEQGSDRRRMTATGAEFTPHVMRHTFASLLVQKGVSIYKVARWLGDGVEVVERHYGHLAPRDQEIED